MFRSGHLLRSSVSWIGLTLLTAGAADEEFLIAVKVDLHAGEEDTEISFGGEAAEVEDLFLRDDSSRNRNILQHLVSAPRCDHNAIRIVVIGDPCLINGWLY